MSNETPAMRASYDDATDVLYVSLTPVCKRARSFDGPRGVVWRVAVDTETTCGATIIGVHQSWGDHAGELIDLLAARLPVHRSVIEEAVKPAVN